MSAPVSLRAFAEGVTKDYVVAAALQLGGWASRIDPARYASGTERPCIALPGVYETWHFMRPMIEALHRRGHPVHVVSALHRNRRPVVDSAELVARFIADRGLDDVFIAAHSKGGLIGKYAMLKLDPDHRLVRMVAVATPFSGSRYARWAPNSTLRAFRADDPTTALLASEDLVNERIVSVFSSFDPIVPEGSELPGAHNVRLPSGGHFDVLRNRRAIEIVTAEAAKPAA